MFQYILFDLDGTLTDPEEGITKSVQYALKALGIDEPDRKKLQHFIGPPLKEQFIRTYGLTEEQGQTALEKYRERFSVEGLYENKVYDGVPELLKELKNDGRTLGIASSKPQVFVEEILKYFHLDGYFDVIVGSELDGRRTAKSEVVAEALRQMGVTEKEKPETMLVGDRLHDVEGAREEGIASLGVSFGYGGRVELEEAGADMIVDKVEEIRTKLG